MAGIPGDNAQTRLTESKAGVPGVSNANRTRGKETGKNILARKEFPNGGLLTVCCRKFLRQTTPKPKRKPTRAHLSSRGVPDTRPHVPHDRAREVAASGTGSRRRGSRVEARRERVRRDTRFATSRRRHDGKRQNILSRWCTNTPTRRSSTAPPRWRACRSCRSRTLSETSSRERTSRRWRSISGIPRSTRIKVRALRP